MKIALAFWKGSTVPESSQSTQLRRLLKRSCLISVTVLCLSAFQHEAQAQTVISQCTNPVCTPGKACALYRCADPRPCLDCTPPPSSGTNCVVGYALGNDADFAGGNVPDVLIESTDYWTIDDSGDVWYDGSEVATERDEDEIVEAVSDVKLSFRSNFMIVARQGSSDCLERAGTCCKLAGYWRWHQLCCTGT
jgi:hypothetical protein